METEQTTTEQKLEALAAEVQAAEKANNVINLEELSTEEVEALSKNIGAVVAQVLRYTEERLNTFLAQYQMKSTVSVQVSPNVPVTEENKTDSESPSPNPELSGSVET